MYRTSDHDPVLLGVALEGEPEPVALCSVRYEMVRLGHGVFAAEVRVKNLSDERLTSWTVNWSYTNGEKVALLLNGIAKQKGADVTVKNLPFNGVIKPGKAVTLGLLGTYKKVLAEPTEFWLNGNKCLVE